MPGKWIKTFLAAELPKGKARAVSVEGKPIAVFHIDDNYVATEELCPHRGGPLSEGVFDAQAVTCPWHKARFDLKTGAFLGGTSKRPIAIYPTRLADGFLEIEI